MILDIRKRLKNQTPNLTEAQRSRMYKILNSYNENFICYGLKVSEIETISKEIVNEYNCTYDDAMEIFKILLKSNVHDEKFAGIFLINRFKKQFDEEMINLFYESLAQHCGTWALCDSSCIRVLGPFLAKKDKLAERTIEKWSKDENLWIRRASMVILLKIIMVKKSFDEKYVFELVENMLKYPEDYIHKGIGWLLKTASKISPDVIFNYLQKNKIVFPRLILRYASEKLPREKRALILKK